MDMSFSDIDFENIGSWPLTIKLIAVIVLSAIILGMGFWFDTKPQLERLGRLQKSEGELRVQFETKQQKAANVDAYRQQLQQMQKTLGALLQQLPGKTEVPGLLEDISKAGLGSGLEFKLFNPLVEVQHDFYAELPIRISVVGNYHQFGDFVSRVAALDRIVTLHDFKIIRADGKTRKLTQPGKKPLKQGRLVMNVTAKTYRYTDG